MYRFCGINAEGSPTKPVLSRIPTAPSREENKGRRPAHHHTLGTVADAVVALHGSCDFLPRRATSKVERRYEDTKLLLQNSIQSIA